MASIRFTGNIQRHLECPLTRVAGSSLGEVLEAYFDGNPLARGYLLEDDGSIRRHVVVFVDGRPARDRRRLSDPVGPDSEVFVFQALSGG